MPPDHSIFHDHLLVFVVIRIRIRIRIHVSRREPAAATAYFRVLGSGHPPCRRPSGRFERRSLPPEEKNPRHIIFRPTGINPADRGIIPHIKAVDSETAWGYLQKIGGTNNKSVVVSLEIQDENREGGNIEAKIWCPDTSNLAAVELGAFTLTMTGVEPASLEAFKKLYAEQNRPAPTPPKVWTEKPVFRSTICIGSTFMPRERTSTFTPRIYSALITKICMG
jgi:hypothetical protein